MTEPKTRKTDAKKTKKKQTPKTQKNRHPTSEQWDQLGEGVRKRGGYKECEKACQNMHRARHGPGQ